MGVRKSSERLIPSEGAKAVAWIEAVCRIPEGKFVGKPVVLREWQREIVRGLYDTPTRRGIISFGRKNGKTAFVAFLLLLHLCGPRSRPNSQLNSAAQSVEQAGVLFRLAAKIVRLSPELQSFVTIRDTAKQLFCQELGTLYRALSAEAPTAFGLSPVFAVHDELGQVRGPRSDLFEAIETAAGAHDDPLSIIISTQAPTDTDLLSILIDDAKTGADPTVKLFMYSAPLELDPFSDEALEQANPALGDFLNASETRKTAESARRMPSRESSYRNLVLNQRISQTSPFIPRAVWEQGAIEPADDVFRTSQVFIGLDLSARNDLTALVMIAQDAKGVWHVRPEFFVPLIGLQDRASRDRAPYDLWAVKGLLTTTPGASVEYSYVAQRLAEICDDYTVSVIGYDRWRMDVLKSELARVSVELPLKEFGQGFRDMSPALDALESELLNGKVRHGGHPVLTWCASNAIAVRDPAGNRKLDKSKATGRIDGIVAMAMAFGVGAIGSTPMLNLDDFLSNPVVI